MYYAFILLIGAERLVELAVSRRNARWSFANGGREFGRGHYPAMVVLHTGLLVGALVEVAVADRPILPVLAGSMLCLVIAAQALRWWCIAALGRQWNTRIVVVPGLPRVTRGPYRWLRHPNYVAVVVEGVALPLVGSAWITALLFSTLNAALLTVRIRAENAALRLLPDYPSPQPSPR